MTQILGGGGLRSRCCLQTAVLGLHSRLTNLNKCLNKIPGYCFPLQCEKQTSRELLPFGFLSCGLWPPPTAQHWLRNSCPRIMGWPGTTPDPGGVGSQITAAYLPQLLPEKEHLAHLTDSVGLYSEEREWLRTLGSRVSGDWDVSCRWAWPNLLNKSASHHGLEQKQTLLLTWLQEGYLIGGVLATRTTWGRKLTVS